MLKRKIKDGRHPIMDATAADEIDKNQNIIENLTKALSQREDPPGENLEEKSVVSIHKDEKSRKKIKANTKFGQVKLRHARRGVSSCLLALMGTFILGGLITNAYQSYGEAPAAVGGLAILTTIFCSFGFMNALHGFRERDKNYITCKVGILFNGIIIFIFCLLYMRGMA